MTELIDITESKERDRLKLMEIIISEVRATQRYVIQPLPHQLKMTRLQYNLLNNLPPDDKSKQLRKFFKTPMNAMEVIIDEAR